MINWMNDGASAQARAVLAYLSMNEGIQESYSKEQSCYLAKVETARWHNCREQGYVLSMRSKNYRKQFNIIFFEHRNSDEICAVKWEQQTINPPTIDTAEFGDVYKDKFDVSFRVSYGEIANMAEWIYEELEQFWVDTAND